VKQRAVTIAVVGVVAAAVAVVGLTTASPALAAPVLCNDSDPFLRSPVSNGRYIVQNNVWGATTRQCIDVNQSGPGFTIIESQHNNTGGTPAAYPSMIFGCHWAATPADCSAGSGLPMQATNPAFNSVSTSVSVTYPSNSSYRWNASYDIWFDPTPRTNGQVTGAEIMVWLNWTPGIFPVGSQVATVNLLGASWEVWFGNIGWNVVSYRRTSPTTSLNFTVNTFFNDAVNRGYAQRAWYLTSIQAGFEPWVGGTGLAVNSFSVGTNTGGDTQPPSTPTNLSASGTTSSSTNLSWTASTDNVGIAGYDILRAPGASGGTFSPVGTSSGTSFANTGLSPSTTYRYQVRARDAAGNLSGVSNTVSVTTAPGTGGGGCSAAMVVQSQWNGGYVIQPVTVTNTGGAQLNGWVVTFTLPAGHSIVGSWNATLTTSGQTVTARNLGYNGTVGPGQRVEFGFQASRPGGNTATPTNFSCMGS
jgi:chitodextrinase